MHVVFYVIATWALSSFVVSVLVTVVIRRSTHLLRATETGLTPEAARIAVGATR